MRVSTVGSYFEVIICGQIYFLGKSHLRTSNTSLIRRKIFYLTLK